MQTHCISFAIFPSCLSSMQQLRLKCYVRGLNIKATIEITSDLIIIQTINIIERPILMKSTIIVINMR